MRPLTTITLFTLILLFCAPFAVAQDASFVQPPTLTMNPYGKAPLAGEISVTTDIASQVSLRVTDGIDLWTVKFPDFATEHMLPLLGLKSGRTYYVEVTLTPGGATDSSLVAVTPALPDDFPAVTLLHTDPPNMEPGFTLVDTVTHGGGDARQTYLMIVDAWGDVVWYGPIFSQATRQLPNGDLWYRCGASICEVDLLGRQTETVVLADPGQGLHHDLFRTSLGTYLSLSRKSIETPDFPTSETDPDAPTETALVRDEPIVEFAADGSLINEWTMSEIIDPVRIAYDSLFGSNLGYDWIHTNAVLYDPTDDSIVVSMRHQDAVVKFARATGELIWILGTHANWKPAFQPFLLQPVGAGFWWQYHQHAPTYTPAGTLLIFDNGNYRASPFDGNEPYPSLTPTDNYSGAVEYAIDEEAMEIERVWEWGSDVDDTIYASFVGDVDWLDTKGNVLISFGGTRVMGGVPTGDLGLGAVVTRVVEVTHETPAQKVFDLLIHDPAEVQAVAYRSERIPSLYGPEVMVASLGPIAVGSVPNGADVAGDPLIVDKVDGGDLSLAWGKSCVSSDLDYAVYEGALGDFTSHAPAACSTAGARTATITPGEGSRYFLVVPMNGSEEGSYGTDSAGAERPPAAAACLEQALAACP